MKRTIAVFSLLVAFAPVAVAQSGGSGPAQPLKGSQQQSADGCASGGDVFLNLIRAGMLE